MRPTSRAQLNAPQMSSVAGVQHVLACDKVLYDALASVFLVNVLGEIPEAITKVMPCCPSRISPPQDIRLFSKCIETWTQVAPCL